MALEYVAHPLLVLVGAFNSQIMRDPAWIKKYLFPQSNQKEIVVNMGIALINNEISSSMKIDGIEVKVDPGKIQITPNDFSQSGYNAIADLVENLSATLPHTPLIAYGINCRLAEPIAKSILQRNRAIIRLSGDKSPCDYIKIERRQKYEKSLLTFSITEECKDEQFRLLYDFNFHFPTEKSKIAPMMLMKEAIIDGDIGKYLTYAYSVANSISSEILHKKDN